MYQGQPSVQSARCPRRNQCGGTRQLHWPRADLGKSLLRGLAGRRSVSERPLVFLHIPKTAGIAVSYALMVSEQPPRVLCGFDPAFFGSFNDFESVPAENRAFIHLSPDTIPRDEKLVRAHMALSTLKAAYPGARFMTVVREPICRLLSHYVFWRGFTEQQDKDWGGWAAYSSLARGRLEAFLADRRIACQI